MFIHLILIFNNNVFIIKKKKNVINMSCYTLHVATIATVHSLVH